jgi:hypothetical protein
LKDKPISRGNLLELLRGATIMYEKNELGREENHEGIKKAPYSHSFGTFLKFTIFPNLPTTEYGSGAGGKRNFK